MPNVQDVVQSALPSTSHTTGQSQSNFEIDTENPEDAHQQIEVFGDAELEFPNFSGTMGFMNDPFMPDSMSSGQGGEDTLPVFGEYVDGEFSDHDLSQVSPCGSNANLRETSSDDSRLPPTINSLNFHQEEVQMSETSTTSKLDVAPHLADHLCVMVQRNETTLANWYRLQLFFQRVQSFLPLLHRPRIYAEFLNIEKGQQKPNGSIDIPNAIFLNSIFALSARFSEKHQFWTTEPKDRGDVFATKAKVLWREHIKDDEGPSLRLLQSRILLAFYELTSAPSFQAWQSTGICCRMAYSLLLHHIDREYGISKAPADTSGQTWVDQEGDSSPKIYRAL